jgi:TetR/AcrR family transcriptional regulator, transcriptional repressor for nem operon
MEVRSSYYAPVRYPPQRKAESRDKIVGAAADLFREGGIAATGLDAVMARAGLTAGAFYAHFDSKQALVRDAVALAGERSQKKWFGRFDALRGRAWVEELFQSYLGRGHRKDVTGGCILPSLGVEVGRQPADVRRHFSQRFQGMLDLIEARASGELRLEREQVIAAVALAVGAVVLSRAVPESRLQGEILMAARHGAEELTGLATRRRSRKARRTTGSKPKKRIGKVKKKA